MAALAAPLLAGCLASFDTDEPLPRCGDGVAQAPEACDGTDLGGASCAASGETGEVLCTASCTLDRSGCLALCGNGVRDAGEACEGEDLGGATCEDVGFYSGTLACGAACDLDVSGCAERCGDGVVNGAEDCDGTDLAGASCQSLGYHAGSLSCSASCAFALDGCLGRCGDDVINGPEVCDGVALGGRLCSDYGYAGGPLGCQPDCLDLDLGACWTSPRVVVNEIFAGQTDWLEIQNISEVAVELAGWQVQWWAIQESQSGTTSGILTLPGYSLAAGQRLVLEESGTPTGDPPVVLAGRIIFNTNVPWGWMGGGVALFNAAAEPLDFVRFGNPAWAPAPPAGLTWQDLPAPLVSPGIAEVTVSLSRVPEGTDTDAAADLCVTEATPGEANLGPCLIPLPPGTLLISEVDPGTPEWVEIYNPGVVALDLGGWRLKTSSTTRLLPAFLLGAGAYVAITDDALDPLAPVADATGLHVGALSLSSTAGNLALLEPVASSGVDFLCWGSFNSTRPTPPANWEDVPARLPGVGAGQTLARGTLIDTDTAGDFCLQLPSLGLANATCP